MCFGPVPLPYRGWEFTVSASVQTWHSAWQRCATLADSPHRLPGERLVFSSPSGKALHADIDPCTAFEQMNGVNKTHHFGLITHYDGVGAGPTAKVTHAL